MCGAALDAGEERNNCLCAPQAKRQDLGGVQVRLSLKSESIKMFSTLFYKHASILSDLYWGLPCCNHYRKTPFEVYYSTTIVKLCSEYTAIYIRKLKR